MSFRLLLPPYIAVRESSADIPDAVLYPIEAASVSNAVKLRRSEFATCRVLAREALAELGADARPIPVGSAREPVWPSGYTGSITHCAGYRAAAVACSADLVRLGIDAEQAKPLNPRTTAVVLSPDEDIESVGVGDLGSAVFFSAKESVYKATFSAARFTMRFHEILITADRAGRFTAEVLSDNVPSTVRSISGRWRIRDGIVFTAALG